MHDTVDTREGRLASHWRNRHKGRGAQALIYTGKLIRMFVYQTDWKVLPMSAVIAALVSMVIRKDFFLTMEGNLKGAFALTCVSIWNGCFNSIQVICRERNVLKREHRAGLHISAYILSHMVYQALLCAAQAVLTLYVCQLMGVHFPTEGLVTRWMMVDLAVTLFLMAYASDMLSLFVSALSHSTTTAMTIMPFVLIFQLVFSGGIFNLPAWSQNLSAFTISSYGLKCVAAQADYNNSPMVTAWNMLQKLRDNEVGGSVTLGQVMDFLGNEDVSAVKELRAREIDTSTTVGEVWEMVNSSTTYQEIRETRVDASFTLGEFLDAIRTSESLQKYREQDILGVATFGEILDELAKSLEETGATEYTLGRVFTVGELVDALHTREVAEALKDTPLGGKTTVGELMDLVLKNKDVQARRDQEITVKTTVGRLIELVGEDRVKDLVQNKTAQASRVADYEHTADNVIGYWFAFCAFALLFALLAMLTLEMIDKDKR